MLRLIDSSTRMTGEILLDADPCGIALLAHDARDKAVLDQRDAGFVELGVEIEAPVAARHEAPALHQIEQRLRAQAAMREAAQPVSDGRDQRMDEAIVLAVLGGDAATDIVGMFHEPRADRHARWCIGVGLCGELIEHRRQAALRVGVRHPNSHARSSEMRRTI